MVEVKNRKIISASEANAEKAKAKRPAKSVKSELPEEGKEVVENKQIQKPSGKKSSKGLRIGAIIFWVLAIAFEVGAIYMLNIAETTFAIVGLVLDAICCITGSLMWKRANRINPCRSKSKFVRLIWNQMGVIACLLAFIPFGLFLLTKADNISPKMKKIIAIIAAVLFIGSTGASIDYNPPTPESVAAAEEAAAANSEYDGTVYWTRWGKSYHLDENCSSLSRSVELISGSMEEAFDAKRNDPCDFCAGGGDDK